MGQIALEQQGCKGEGTRISSWGLDEVIVSPSTVEAFGPVTAKHCSAQISSNFSIFDHGLIFFLM